MVKLGYTSRFIIALVVAAAFALPAGPAFALSSGEYVGKTAAEITESLKKHGYDIREIDREGDILEAEVILDGKLYEISADSRTGKIVEIIEGGAGENEGSIIRRLFGIGGDKK